MANSPVNRTSFIFLQTGEERSGGVRRLCWQDNGQLMPIINVFHAFINHRYLIQEE
jgi:hypothetical protein